MPAPERSVRVLVVDDSPVFRARLQQDLDAARGVQVVGTAPDPFVARDQMRKLYPDMIVLDIEMPRMNGLEFLKKVMHYRPTPVVVVSSLTPRGCKLALECLQAGAIDVLRKPGPDYSAEELAYDLIQLARGVGGVRLSPIDPRAALPSSAGARDDRAGGSSVDATRVVAIGASTGGTTALREVLPALTRETPGILIVQHMPEGFTRSLARSLDQVCALDVHEASDGDRVLPGTVLLAPGNQHLKLGVDAGGYVARVDDGRPVRRHRPSVDVLFQTLARHAGPNAMAVLLTGMGDDGAAGMLQVRQAGGFTVAQDAETCTIHGMPFQAVRLGGVRQELPLGAIAGRIRDFGAGRVARAG